MTTATTTTDPLAEHCDEHLNYFSNKRLAALLQLRPDLTLTDLDFGHPLLHDIYIAISADDSLPYWSDSILDTLIEYFDFALTYRILYCFIPANDARWADAIDDGCSHA